MSTVAISVIAFAAAQYSRDDWSAERESEQIEVHRFFHVTYTGDTAVLARW